MTQPGFSFNANTFVQEGHESASGEWSDNTLQDIAKIRSLYPELKHWGDLALGCAFGDFSQDVLAVSWANWAISQRDELFLNYCCWRQTKGPWEFGLDSDTLDMNTTDFAHIDRKTIKKAIQALDEIAQNLRTPRQSEAKLELELRLREIEEIQKNNDDKKIMDTDGENRPLRCFLMQYGQPSLTVGAMKKHMTMCGYPFWPKWVNEKADTTHLTKGGAQSWIRHLLSLEHTKENT
jgi:hypothetical protein